MLKKEEIIYLHVQLLSAHGHNGPVDVWLAHATLDVGSTGSQCVDSCLNAGLGASGIDDGIGTQSKVALVCEEFGVLLSADSLRAENVCSSVLLSKLETLLVDVYSNNLGGTERLCDGHTEQTNRTCAKDNNTLARLDVGLLGDVHTDTQWLDQCGFLERDVICDLVAEVFGKAVVLGKGSVIRRGSCKGHVNAEVVLALSAAWASAARNTRLHGDTVALLECRHLVSHFLDNASRLVAQNHGGLDHEVSNSTVCPVVYIGPTDTSVLDIDNYVVRISELGNRTVLELDAVGLLKDK